MPSDAIAIALAIGVGTFIVGLILGQPIIRQLARAGVGKEINPWGPATHQAKTGTPAMGGVIIVLSIVLVTVATNLLGKNSILLPLAALAATGLLGAYDDYRTLVGRKSEGLSPAMKMLGLTVIAAVTAL